MQRSFTTRALLVASLLAGCSKSDFRLADRERQRLQPVKESAVLNAEDEAMPSIMPQTHFAAGRMFETQGDFNKAAAQYQKAIAQNPQHISAHHRLGLLFSRMNRHEEAVASFRRAVTLKPDMAMLHNNLGFELMYLQKWEESEAQLRRATELDPTFARAHVNLALLHSRLGRHDESLATFRRVLHEPDAYYNLGLLHRGQRRFADAADAFRHVLELRPNSVAARAQLDEVEDLIRAEAEQSAAKTPEPPGPAIQAAAAMDDPIVVTAMNPAPLEIAPPSEPKRTPAADPAPTSDIDAITAVVDNEIRCIEERVARNLAQGHLPDSRDPVTPSLGSAAPVEDHAYANPVAGHAAATERREDESDYRLFRSPYGTAAPANQTAIESAPTRVAPADAVAHAPVDAGPGADSLEDETPYKIEIVKGECGPELWTGSWQELTAWRDLNKPAEAEQTLESPVGPPAELATAAVAEIEQSKPMPQPTAPAAETQSLLAADRMNVSAPPACNRPRASAGDARMSAWDAIAGPETVKPLPSDQRGAAARTRSEFDGSVPDLDAIISVVRNEWNCVEALIASQSRSEWSLGVSSAGALASDGGGEASANPGELQGIQLRDIANPPSGAPDYREPRSLLTPNRGANAETREPMKN